MIQAKLREREAILGQDFPIYVDIFEDSTPAAISGGTITVLPPYSVDKLVEDAQVEITDNTVYFLLAASSMSLGKNYSIVLKIMMSGQERQFTFLFHVLRQKWIPCITDEDLKNYHPLLQEDLWPNENNYSKQIEESFRLLKADVRNKGKDIYVKGLIDSEDLRELHILRTFEMIFNDFSREQDDIWWTRKVEADEKYKSRFNNIHFEFDTNYDGIPDQEHKGRSVELAR